MTDPSDDCAQCGRELSYVATKHDGCPDCGHLPLRRRLTRRHDDRG